VCPWNFENLRQFQDRVVRIRSTEGEVMVAKVVLVDQEHQDLIMDVLSTDQPDRYDRLGKKYDECAWAIPFEFIADIALNPAPDGGAE
jgi:hypothetical protein